MIEHKIWIKMSKEEKDEYYMLVKHELETAKNSFTVAMYDKYSNND